MKLKLYGNIKVRYNNALRKLLFYYCRYAVIESE